MLAFESPVLDFFYKENNCLFTTGRQSDGSNMRNLLCCRDSQHDKRKTAKKSTRAYNEKKKKVIKTTSIAEESFRYSE